MKKLLLIAALMFISTGVLAEDKWISLNVNNAYNGQSWMWSKVGRHFHYRLVLARYVEQNKEGKMSYYATVYDCKMSSYAHVSGSYNSNLSGGHRSVEWKPTKPNSVGEEIKNKACTVEDSTDGKWIGHGENLQVWSKYGYTKEQAHFTIASMVDTNGTITTFVGDCAQGYIQKFAEKRKGESQMTPINSQWNLTPNAENRLVSRTCGN